MTESDRAESRASTDWTARFPTTVPTLALLIATAACSGSGSGAGDAPVSDDPALADSARAARVTSPGDTAPEDEVHATRVAILMEATPEDWDSLRAERSEEDFHVIADDAMYYRAAAREYLEERGVRVVGVTGRRALRFVVEGRPEAFDFSDETTLDVLVLYEPGSRPRAVAPIEVHVADEYFGLEAVRR